MTRSAHSIRLLLILLLTGMAAGVSFVATPSQANEPQEFQVKAAMVYNVAKFVEWQGGGGSGPMLLCVYGRNPFGSALSSLNGKTVNGRPLSVKMISDPSEIEACQILYVNSAERRAKFIFGAALKI